VQDFVIQGPRNHGLPGLINLFGIESPGLTSSLAIADYVCELAGTPAAPASQI
jgi:L-2-hydroxyglutarate oxidase LhgO